VSDEIKMVIYFKGETATIGISKPNCDPIFGIVEGNRDEIVQRALQIMFEAEEKWRENPRNKKFEGKLPSQEAPPPKPATMTQQITTKTTKKKEQTVLF
jgi:hypothetical protein